MKGLLAFFVLTIDVENIVINLIICVFLYFVSQVRLDSATTNSRPGKPKLHSFNDLRPVYTGSLNTQVKSVKAFSLTSSVIALALQPLMFEKLVLNQPVLTGMIFWHYK